MTSHLSQYRPHEMHICTYSVFSQSFHYSTVTRCVLKYSKNHLHLLLSFELTSEQRWNAGACWPSYNVRLPQLALTFSEGIPGKSGRPSLAVSGQAGDSERPNPDLHTRPPRGPLPAGEEILLRPYLWATSRSLSLLQHSASSHTKGKQKGSSAARPVRCSNQQCKMAAPATAPLPSCRKSSRISTPPPITLQKELPNQHTTTHQATSSPPVPGAHQPGPSREGADHGRGDAHRQHLCR